jgi:hypothetical protein
MISAFVRVANLSRNCSRNHTSKSHMTNAECAVIGTSRRKRLELLRASARAEFVFFYLSTEPHGMNESEGDFECSNSGGTSMVNADST